MGDRQYGLPDLRQLLAGRTDLAGTPQAVFEPFFILSRNLASPPPPQPPPQPQPQPISLYESSIMFPNNYLGKLDHYYCTNATNTTIPISTINGSTLGGVEMESGWNNNGIGNDNNGGCSSGNSSRWPRQETLTLLEIRSRLDPRFKEANQKGPLWDEVSRIMAEEFGYQRTGKKCREKFENLYKYYKKTREGKTGRQDGKHYRFFPQLEAIYGGTSNQAPAFQSHVAANSDILANYQTPVNYTELLEENKQSITESLSFSTTSEFETSSSENNDDDLSAIAYMMNRSKDKQKGVANHESQSFAMADKRSWKAKVKDYVDLRMREVMEAQEVWMDTILKTVEDRELERRCRQEEWMKKEEDRFDQEHGIRAKERAWMEARDAALMDALKKHAGKRLVKLPDLSIEQMAVASHRQEEINNSIRWSEPEILSLIQLRSAMEPRFQESGNSRSEVLWEEIAAKMVSLGYDRRIHECIEKWDDMNFYFTMTSDQSNEKWKADFEDANYTLRQFKSCNKKEEARERIERINVASNSYMSSQVHGGFFQLPVSEENLWDKYDLTLSNEKNQFK